MGSKNIFKQILVMREFMIFAIVFITGLLLSFITPLFLTKTNIVAVLLGLAIPAIVAIGMTILMVAGGFDLSVGSTVAFTGAMTAMAMQKGLPVFAAVLIGLLIGAIIGFVNGLIIARIGINPFITTLAMMTIVRGALLVITEGKVITGFPKEFTVIGQGNLFGIQFPVIIAIILVIIGDILLRKTRFFRQNYYIGANEKAAILSGINVVWLKTFGYVIAGFLAALAGVILTARLGAAVVTAATGLELEVVTAVIVGGASLSGGEGSVTGSIFGALFMALIVNALNLLGVDIYWNQLVIGSTLLIAVIVDSVVKKRRII